MLFRSAANNSSAASSALVTSTLPDTSAPSVPTGLIAGTKTITTITFTWTASVDNVLTTGYKIFRNGGTTPIGTTTGATTYTDTGLTQNTSYSYTVSAFDAANNNSAQSTALVVSTPVKQGDINSDNSVDSGDFAILAANYNKAGTYTFVQGDLNNDQTVNIIDLTILAIAWGT